MIVGHGVRLSGRFARHLDSEAPVELSWRLKSCTVCAIPDLCETTTPIIGSDMYRQNHPVVYRGGGKEDHIVKMSKAVDNRDTMMVH